MLQYARLFHRRQLVTACGLLALINSLHPKTLSTPLRKRSQTILQPISLSLLKIEPSLRFKYVRVREYIFLAYKPGTGHPAYNPDNPIQEKDERDPCIYPVKKNSG